LHQSGERQIAVHLNSTLAVLHPLSRECAECLGPYELDEGEVDAKQSVQLVHCLKASSRPPNNPALSLCVRSVHHLTTRGLKQWIRAFAASLAAVAGLLFATCRRRRPGPQPRLQRRCSGSRRSTDGGPDAHSDRGYTKAKVNLNDPALYRRPAGHPARHRGTRAKAILASRADKGAFHRKEDLVKRGIIPQNVFDGLKDCIGAGGRQQHLRSRSQGKSWMASAMACRLTGLPLARRRR